MRVAVNERRDVAELLAGGSLAGPVDELVDEDLRALAVAVLLLRAWRRLVDEEVLLALVRAQGAHVEASECEALRREAAMARRAA